MQWAGLPTLKYQESMVDVARRLHEDFKVGRAADLLHCFNVISPTSVINFGRSLVFAQNGNPVWQELINAEGWEAKKALLTDPAWLARARIGWDNTYAHSYFHDANALTLRESETGYGPIGVTLADYMKEAGFSHASDAMAEWVLNNGAEFGHPQAADGRSSSRCSNICSTTQTRSPTSQMLAHTAKCSAAQAITSCC